MRLLLDSCMSGRRAAALREAGHDVIWTGDWAEDPGDEAVLAYAFLNQRVLITLDKDFGELVVVHNRPHAGIIRLVGVAPHSQTSLILAALTEHGNLLGEGGLVVIESERMRIRTICR